jgi:hypothetical protein
VAANIQQKYGGAKTMNRVLIKHEDSTKQELKYSDLIIYGNGEVYLRNYNSNDRYTIQLSTVKHITIIPTNESPSTKEYFVKLFGDRTIKVLSDICLCPQSGEYDFRFCVGLTPIVWIHKSLVRSITECEPKRSKCIFESKPTPIEIEPEELNEVQMAQVRQIVREEVKQSPKELDETDIEYIKNLIKLAVKKEVQEEIGKSQKQNTVYSGVEFVTIPANIDPQFITELIDKILKSAKYGA